MKPRLMLLIGILIGVMSTVDDSMTYSPDMEPTNYVITTAPYGTGHILWFPHVASKKNDWETEICIINAGAININGVLRPYNNSGHSISSDIPISLSPHSRRQITMGDEFTTPDKINYIIFESDSDELVGYVKFYKEGLYRASVPAVSSANWNSLCMAHIASDSQWETGIALVNTEASSKTITIEFDNSRTTSMVLASREHKSFTIRELFNGEPQPDIKSGIIRDAKGIIGMEVFSGTAASEKHILGSILLKNNTAVNICYPHVVGNSIWGTGIVTYNHATLSSNITITTHKYDGATLSHRIITLPGHGKYIGTPHMLSLPSSTAWIHMEGSNPISGFELLGTSDGNRLAGYTGVGTAGKRGIFPKIEKDGSTGIVLVNTEASIAHIILTAYDDTGSVVATRDMILEPYAKQAGQPENLFAQDMIPATYIEFSSDKEIAGFQLNESSDRMMLDALPTCRPNQGDENGDNVSIIADHTAVDDFENLSRTMVRNTINKLHIFYGHTSHGSQILTGMQMLQDSTLDFGSLDITELSDDLGHNGDVSWADRTRAYLAAHQRTNLVIWSWCGGVSDNTTTGIQAYLDAMDQLEHEYPGICFVYMTGHTDGSGENGRLRRNNKQIRTYCTGNNKILFDFEDIESWDPDSNYYPDANDNCEWCSTWCMENPCPSCDHCAHSHCFNCYIKGKAMWWLLVNIADHRL